MEERTTTSTAGTREKTVEITPTATTKKPVVTSFLKRKSRWGGIADVKKSVHAIMQTKVMIDEKFEVDIADMQKMADVATYDLLKQLQHILALDNKEKVTIDGVVIERDNLMNLQMKLHAGNVINGVQKTLHMRSTHREKNQGTPPVIFETSQEIRTMLDGSKSVKNTKKVTKLSQVDDSDIDDDNNEEDGELVIIMD